jgi:hypothetical protein
MMLAATASAVGRLKEAGMLEATTVANFKDKSELRAAAASRVIWCDEACISPVRGATSLEPGFRCYLGTRILF